MVAFLADHLDGDLRPDPMESEGARRFRLDALPQLPNALSIEGWMLDAAMSE